MDKKKDSSESSISVGKPGVETFTKLWSSLRTFYNGTNVPRTIAKLLHIYEPEDGILVYAKLLRTLYSMLGNFDPRGFCTLVSMIPPPKGATEHTVEKVFYDSTGHYRLKVPVLRFNNNSSRAASTSETKICNKKVTQQNCTFVPSTSNSVGSLNLKRSIDEANLPLKKRKSLFANEFQITPPQTNLKSFKALKSIQTLQPLNNQSLQKYHKKESLPNANVEIKWPQESVSSQKKLPQTTDGYQNKANKNLSSNSFCLVNSNKIVKVSNRQLSRQGEAKSHQQASINGTSISKKKDKIVDKSMQFFHISMRKPMDKQERKLQRAIQKDIYKMDHVRSDSEGCDDLPVKKDIPFKIQKNLNQSLKNYLEHVKNEITIEGPDFPNTSPLALVQYPTSPPVNMIKKETKIIDMTSIERKIICESPTLRQTLNSSSSQVKPNTISSRRKRPEGPTRPRSERVAQRNLLLQNSNNDSKTSSELINAKRKRTTKENVNRAQSSALESSKSDHDKMPVATMLNYPSSEMSSFKNQYCDAFMSIQRAKIAVANSLAISSVRNTAGCYPYYVDYFNRQHHSMQQQQQYMMDPFCLNNWRFPPYGQYRVPQPAHTTYCTMSASNHKYSMIPGTYYQSASSSEEFPVLQKPKLELPTKTCPNIKDETVENL